MTLAPENILILVSLIGLIAWVFSFGFDIMLPLWKGDKARYKLNLNEKIALHKEIDDKETLEMNFQYSDTFKVGVTIMWVMLQMALAALLFLFLKVVN